MTKIVVDSGLPTLETTEAAGIPVAYGGVAAAEIPAVIDRVAGAIDYLRAGSMARERVGAGDVRIRRAGNQQVIGIEFGLPEPGTATVSTLDADVHAFAHFVQAAVGAAAADPGISSILVPAATMPGQYPDCRSLAARVIDQLSQTTAAATPEPPTSAAAPTTPVAAESLPTPLLPSPATQLPPAPQVHTAPPTSAADPGPTPQFPPSAVSTPPAAQVPTGPTPQFDAATPGQAGPPMPPEGLGMSQPYAAPAPDRRRRKHVLVGVGVAAVIALVAAAVGVWALNGDDETANLDAAKSAAFWEQQIGVVTNCATDSPGSHNADGVTVNLETFYRRALVPCFAQMWRTPLAAAGTPMPDGGYTMTVSSALPQAGATGVVSSCATEYRPGLRYVNCPKGFWLRDTTEQYSELPVAYAYDLSASMVAYQALITSGVVESVTDAMELAGSSSEEAAGFSRALNAAAACLGGVMVKTHQGQGLSDADVAMIRNTATFGSVSADAGPAFDVTPGNYRYWRNYGIDHPSIEACRLPLENQEHVK
ncbi:hypothetical protein QSJ18_13345 [Gordonia sp. ABSL1-1]|uniref:hypothetical protein n=1 Tax=Gordonia sp. ABSL1-1 TaxID=3053923 RepID=UPI0025727D4B|nr:hypothetical protein [Gordonia sp. ABSL1-1]MDL9937732.1 hypothetical protein [Gordonia sp. ABSL1-1]